MTSKNDEPVRSRTAPTDWTRRLARRGGGIELLHAPAVLFGGIVRARRALFDLGLLPVARLPVPVVSIGNLTAGGTGKTPTAAWVVRELVRRSRRPGILSRGYGAVEGGPNDEASLLSRLCPGVPHVQDPKRARGGAQLVGHGVDVVVLDDGFQHRWLARDLDLVLVDALRPWGLPRVEGAAAVRALLPRGLLREPPSSLERADAIVITRSDQVPAAEIERLEAEVARLAPGRPLARAVHTPRAWRTEAGEEHPLASLADKKVDVLTALGNPDAFEATLRGLGLAVREHRALPDHHRFTAADLEGLGKGRPLVVSGKDAVKLDALGAAYWCLEIDLSVTSGAAPLQALLDALPQSEGERRRDALHEGLHG